MIRVKIMVRSDRELLEKAINEFLREEIESLTGTTNGDQVIDIKLAIAPDGLYALLIF